MAAVVVVALVAPGPWRVPKAQAAWAWGASATWVDEALACPAWSSASFQAKQEQRPRLDDVKKVAGIVAAEQQEGRRPDGS